MDARPINPRRPRRGFTLVEMLVVVLIIGILAGLITAAAFKAMDRAKLTVIKLDCSQLDMGMNAYKDKTGDYPPDFWGVALTADNVVPGSSGSIPACDAARSAVVRYLRKAFPRYIPGRPSGNTGTEWERVSADVAQYFGGAFPGFRDLTPASAIVFWLGGMPALDGSKTLTGFSANPENPFAIGGSRTERLFEFDETRLVGFNETLATPAWRTWPTYVPEGIRIRYPGNPMPEENVPYVYFKARTNATTGRPEYGDVLTVPTELVPFSYQHPQGSTANVCTPYISAFTGATGPEVLTAVRTWENPTSFQIIAPGLDARFSGPQSPAQWRFTKDPTTLTDGDLDNVTNFSKGKLDDEIKQ